MNERRPRIAGAASYYDAGYRRLSRPRPPPGLRRYSGYPVSARSLTNHRPSSFS
jgi:hypothetical protein